MRSELSAIPVEARFRVWLYMVSHCSLLLRAEKAMPDKSNVDLLFTGTLYIELPTEIGSLEIGEATEDEVRHVAERLGMPGRLNPGAVYVLIAQERRYLIAASSMRVETNRFEPNQHSLFV